MRILIVDDDEILVDVLKRSLLSQRHVVEVAEDGEMGWEYVQTGEYELIVLDVNLPGLDGISLCEKMRAEGYATPILLMTAKNATQDRILGLDAGADDYLTKPLDLGELNARIRALSRRGEVATTSVLEVNGLALDPSSCEVSYQQQPIKLTAKEYSLLEIFLRHPARVFSRSQILDKIWTFDDPPLEESVKAHIKGLRKKLKKAGVVDWIENVYGIGYRLNPKARSPVVRNSSVEQEFNRKLEQMWLKHQATMRDRMATLHHAVSLVKQSQLPPETKHNAERAAHKLAGVLGMFDRQAGTDVASEIETLLQDNSELNSQQQQQLIDLVADLDRLLALDNTSTKNTTAENLLPISGDTDLHRNLQQSSQIKGSIEQNKTISATILIVDDDPILLDAVRSLLEPWGIEVVTLDKPLHFWEVLRSSHPDLVILDIQMPEIDGIELCQTLRSDPDWQQLPVLFLTAKQDVPTIKQVFDVGGDDYISKPAIGAELIARINNRLDRSRLLHRLATQDRVTGLTNRYQSSREIETLLQAPDNVLPFCLAVIKMSDLEQINFQYGHQAGDRILAQWGKLIQAAFRKDEITSYWGNGDFIIGMPNFDKAQGKEHLTELLTILRKQIFNSQGDCPKGLTSYREASTKLSGINRRHRFQAVFTYATAEYLQDGDTLHSLYQTCIREMLKY